jgi:spermidine/putrescine transport system substrate-binding protein
MLDPKTRNNKAAYPDEAEVKKGEFQADVGDAIMIYEKYWEMLKTQ